jgi:hypothetical protein
VEKDTESKLLVIEIRILASKLADSGGLNPLTELNVDLDAASLSDLRQIRSHFRDLHRSLGGSRGQ